MQILAMIPMMAKEAAVSKFALLLKQNTVVNFTILESRWVLANYLFYLNFYCISSSIEKHKKYFVE